jgi:hypothetical protein
MKHSNMEYQVRRNFQWVFCSYSTFISDLAKMRSCRKRNIKYGAGWDENYPSSY